VNDKKIGVRKENVRFSRRRINRQMEDFEAGKGPRIIIKPSHGFKHQIPVTKYQKLLQLAQHQLNNQLFL
jgi:hypothetical protein